MRFNWIFLAAAGLLVACHNDNKPAEDPSTTGGTIGPVSGSTSTGINNTQSATTPVDPTLQNNASANVSAATDPAANGYGTNNAGPPPSYGGNTGNAGTTSGYNVTNGSNGAPDTMHASSTAGTADTTDADRKLTANVQLALSNVAGLSASAKKIGVDSQGGRVTLRGEVKNEAEHAKITKTAKKVAGETQVDDQLTVKK